MSFLDLIYSYDPLCVECKNDLPKIRKMFEKVRSEYPLIQSHIWTDIVLDMGWCKLKRTEDTHKHFNKVFFHVDGYSIGDIDVDKEFSIFTFSKYGVHGKYKMLEKIQNVQNKTDKIERENKILREDNKKLVAYIECQPDGPLYTELFQK